MKLAELIPFQDSVHFSSRACKLALVLEVAVLAAASWFYFMFNVPKLFINAIHFTFIHFWAWWSAEL